MSSSLDLVEVPLVVLVQTRVASAMNVPLVRMPVDVLEGRRRSLTRSRRVGGGLVRWRPDAPIPGGVTSSGCSTDLVPVGASCNLCHDSSGGPRRLVVPMSRNGVADTAARLVIEHKKSDGGYERLVDTLLDRAMRSTTNGLAASW